MQKAGVLLASLLIMAVLCTAQQYSFVQYTPKDGLINSRIRKSYQDSKGRMYFLTYSGLSVYDGARFKNFTTQNGLASNLLNDMLEIGDDSLLVATNTIDLNIFHKGKISVLQTADNFRPLVNQFYKHSDNNIYASSDFGLYAYKNNKFQTLNILPLRSDYITSPYFGSLTGYDNYLILSTNDLRSSKGLYLYDIKANRICDQIPDQSVAGLMRDGSNRVWVSSTNKLFILDTASLAKGKLVLKDPPPPYDQFKNQVYCMGVDKNGGWLAFMNGKIIWISPNSETLQIPIPKVIATSGVRHILVDKENTLWLSNDGAGMFKLSNNNLLISDNPVENLAPGSYRAFCTGDTTWLSTGSRQLFRRIHDQLSNFTCNIIPAPLIFHQTGTRLFGYDSHKIYEGVVNEESKLATFHPVISISDTDHFGKKVVIDPYGNFIATLQSGISVWSKNKLLFHIPLGSSDLIEGLTIDKDNHLWLVARYHLTTVYTLHPEDPSHYLQVFFQFERKPPDISARSFVIDKSGLAWVGTRTHGIFVYKKEGSQWKTIYHFHTNNGLMDDFITSLSCDSSGNIIAGSQTGLDRILKDTGNTYRIENITKSNNFFAYIDQTWTDARNHTYALTSTGGLLELVPARDKRMYPPQLLIEEMRVNGQPALQGKSIFPHRENNISFFIAAPSFIDEAQISYSYLLEGSGNNQWSDTTPGNSLINLINLSAGRYLLKVEAFFPSTPYASSEISYAFEIKPPWWQTWWFRSIVGVLIIGLFITGFRYYYRNKLRQQRAVLEKKQAVEKERTRIATDMHDDLGAGLSRIKFLSETIGIKKQKQLPIEEDISKIREYSHEMIDKMGEIVWALNEKNDSLSDLLSYTRSYTAEYLSQNGIQCKVSLPENIPSSFVSGEFRRNIFLAVKEILHNVVKHAQANAVDMSILLMSSNLIIWIQDNGTGFDRNNIRPFSNGLINIEKRMKDIGGSMEIQSGKGTIVILSVAFFSK